MGDDFPHVPLFRIYLSTVDTCSRQSGLLWFGCFAGYGAPRAVFLSTSLSVAIPQVQFLVKVICPSGVFGQTAQETVDFLQLPFIERFRSCISCTR